MGENSARRPATSLAKPGARPMPPPSTISSGSTTATTAPSARATISASPATISRACSSPAAAAANTPRALRSRDPDFRAALTMAAAEAADFEGAASPRVDELERFAAKPQEGDLARRAVRAAMQLSVDDEPHADSSADRDEGEGRHVAAVAVYLFGDRRSVDVVLDPSSGPNNRRSSRRTAGRSQPGRLAASRRARPPGSSTPGLPTTVCSSPPLSTPASRRRSEPRADRSRTLAAPLEERAGRLSRARTAPERSVTAPRTNSRPTSRPRTKPASLRISYSLAFRPRPPARRPACSTSASRSRLVRARATVGFESPEALTRSLRETGPFPRIRSSRSCSLSVRINLGRAAPVVVVAVVTSLSRG